MKRKINFLISAVLILLILPLQFGCNKDKLQPVQTEDPAVEIQNELPAEIPQEITLSAEEMQQYMGKEIDADLKTTYYLYGNTNEGWICTSLPIVADDTQEEAEGYVEWVAEYIASNYINEHYVKEIFLKAGQNLPFFVLSKANLVVTIFDLIWQSTVVTCPESFFHLVITNEETGATATTESDTEFDAGYFEAATSIFQGDDQVNHWLFRIYEVSHANGQVVRAQAVIPGYDWLLPKVGLGGSAMLIWDKRFFANETNTAYYLVAFKNSFDNPNYFTYYSQARLSAN